MKDAICKYPYLIKMDTKLTIAIPTIVKIIEMRSWHFIVGSISTTLNNEVMRKKLNNK